MIRYAFIFLTIGVYLFSSDACGYSDFYRLPVKLQNVGKVMMQYSSSYGAGVGYFDNKGNRLSLDSIGIDRSEVIESQVLIQVGLINNLNVLLLAPVVNRETHYLTGRSNSGGGIADCSFLILRQFGKDMNFYPSLSFVFGLKIPSGKSRWSRYIDEESITSSNGALEILTAIMASKELGPLSIDIENSIAMPVPYRIGSFNGSELTKEQHDYPYQAGTKISFNLGLNYKVTNSIFLYTSMLDVISNDDIQKGIYSNGYIESGQESFVNILHGFQVGIVEYFALTLGLGYDVSARNGISYFRYFAAGTVRIY